MTGRQRQVLALIQRHHEVHGTAPTHAEIAVGLDMSHPSLAADHVKALLNLGLVDRKPKASRSLRLTSLGREKLGLDVHPEARAVERRTQLLVRTIALLEQIVPDAPLLAEIRKEIA